MNDAVVGSQPYTNHSQSRCFETSHDLREVLEQYKTQPDILKLILTSKMEEDRRRTEEAKLRAKELDLLHHKHRLNPRTARHDFTPLSPSPDPIPPTTANATAESPLIEDYHHQQRRHSAAAAMLAMGTSTTTTPATSHDSYRVFSSTSTAPYTLPNVYPSPVQESDDFHDHEEPIRTERPRRRREMQAITKIVETREFPYVDNYFWKNNGNTIQKKTGCKSVYYKCSNSTKGCSVNKTVVARPNGQYQIKYRGSHLRECGKVERINEL